MEECIYHPFGLLHKDRDPHLTASVSDEARAALRKDDAILANPNTGKRALEQKWQISVRPPSRYTRADTWSRRLMNSLLRDS